MGERYGESGLPAADRSRVREQCPGVDRWDAPRRGDGSSQKTGRGHSAGYVSTYISPNLCPGLPFIRSTRGSSYEDRPTDAGLIFYFTRRERELPRLGKELRSCISSFTAQGQLVVPL